MKTIQEKIAVMQAFADGKKIETKSFERNYWADTIIPVWNWHCFDYRVKPSEPRTWEEFCEQNNEVNDEYYLHADGHILPSRDLMFRRDLAKDALLLKTKEDAEGLLALIKLKRLRDAWWGDWKPDYFDSRSEKFYICKECFSRDHGSMEVYSTFRYPHFLAFETKEMAEDFLGCFKDLINKAEMWL